MIKVSFENCSCTRVVLLWDRKSENNRMEKNVRRGCKYSYHKNTRATNARAVTDYRYSILIGSLLSTWISKEFMWHADYVINST